MERDLTAHTAAFETADASKWVNRQGHCSTQPRATINMNISTSPSGRSVTEAAERRGQCPPEGAGPARGEASSVGLGEILAAAGGRGMLL